MHYLTPRVTRLLGGSNCFFIIQQSNHGGGNFIHFREIGENLLIKSFKIGLFCLKLRKFRKIHDKIGLFSFLSRGKFINLQNPARENLYVAWTYFNPAFHWWVVDVECFIKKIKCRKGMVKIEWKQFQFNYLVRKFLLCIYGQFRQSTVENMIDKIWPSPPP